MQKTMYSARDFQPRTLVRNTQNGALGVVVQDYPGPMKILSHDEVAVVYQGANGFAGTDYKQLEAVGEEASVASAAGCGVGQGAECCRFLLIDGRGLHCERFGPMRHALMFAKDKVAKREPTELFPNCQLPA